VRLARGVGLAALAASSALGAPGGADERLTSLAGPGHILRVGLAPGRSIGVGAARPYRVIDPATGRDAWRSRHEGTLRVVVDGVTGGSAAARFRVQVGAFARRDAAADELRRLAAATGADGVVSHDADRDTYRVRLGDAADRLELAGLVEALRRTGVADPWIVEEPPAVPVGARLRLIDAAWNSHLTPLARVAVLPAAGETIDVDGKAYRGLIELRVGPGGDVRPVNWVELESYLRGVVPAELGPEVWPEIEALAAQAVAARTYAWRNRGQFAAEGFDVCATPRCQAYEGHSAEHPLSDQAIRATRGLILTHERAPIQALYTATCGGHTEDDVEIFPERDEPYLRAVACRPGRDELDALRLRVRGASIAPLVDESGADVTRDVALLCAAAVVECGPAGPDEARRPVEPRRLREWTRALAERSHRPPPPGDVRPTPSFAAAVESMLADAGWAERLELLLSDDDVAALLRGPDVAELPSPQRRALAWLSTLDALRPFEDGRLHPQRPASLARLAPGLVRVGEAYRAFGLRDAVFAGPGGAGTLRLRGDDGAVRLAVAAGARLFAQQSGQPVPVAELELWPGDRLTFRRDAAGAIDFLELRPPTKGAADDRSSKVYSWETRRTAAQLQEAVDRRLAVGRLRDLTVARRGASGRVVELDVVGSQGTARVRGFDVRRLLDLRESLFVLDLQRDAQGEIEAVVFTGKGWGHGVGLCQVGAYGMALRGAAHREILAHYYPGAVLTSLDAPTP